MKRIALAGVLCVGLLLTGCAQRAFGGSTIKNDVRNNVDYNSGAKNAVTINLPSPDKFSDTSSSKKQELIYTALWDLRRKVSSIVSKEGDIDFARDVSKTLSSGVIMKLVQDKWLKPSRRSKIESSNFIASYKLCLLYGRDLLVNPCTLFVKHRYDIESYLIKRGQLKKGWGL